TTTSETTTSQTTTSETTTSETTTSETTTSETTTSKTTTSETTTSETTTSETTTSETTTSKTTTSGTTTSETTTSGTTTTIIITVQDVVIAKKDITGKTEVKGAKLQVIDQKSGDEVDSWTSDDSDHTIAGEKFTIGETYVLKETGAPNGYAYAADITFTINEDGTIQVDASNLDDNGTIVMKDDVTRVSITKVELVVSGDGTETKELPGAKLELYYVTQNEAGETTEELVDSWTSTNEAHVINGELIAGGTYKLVETQAPNGYQIAEAVTFTVNMDGTVKNVIMTDAAEGQIVISKQSINGTEELAGATLKITNSKGKTIKTWVSKETAEIVQLDAGEYTLTEETAPNGYIVAESIQFTVDKDGKVTVNGEDAGGKIVMKDDTTKVSISKQDITGDKEIPGAKLQVLDKNGKVVEEWTSTTEKHFIEGELTAGETYTLHEENAPDGYAYAEDVTFTVDKTGKVTEVVMKDDVTKVTISKQDITGDKEVPGAKLQILDKNGEVVEEWTSTTEKHFIEGELTAGETYTLHEENAPDGYAY
ncbi:MAG: collagen binding domain-containing protein, partial [Ruminococcus sp.]